MASLTIGNYIGSGAYGAVFLARWGVRKVAIKKFNLTMNEAKQEAAVMEEIGLLEKLRDRHIVQFYGSTSHDGKLVLVMDYADGGSLQAAIKKGKINSWPNKTRIALEVARGLAYIHQENILHRDLKSANVLLTRHNEVKLCDFGLAKVKLTSVSASSAGGDSLKGTFRWMAPELFSARPKYSNKSDIYALGMLLWEMAANNITPFQEQLDNYAVMCLVKSGEREELPDDTPAEYRQWVEHCWEQDPSKRPEAHELASLDDDHTEEEEQHGASTTDSVDVSMSFSSMSISLLSQPSTTGTIGSINSDSTLEELKPSTSSTSKFASTDTMVDHQLQPSATSTVEFASVDTTVDQLQPSATSTVGFASANATAEQLRPSESITLLSRAESGELEAQVELALMYEKGIGGTDKSEDDAFKWYVRAAQQGDAHAQNKMGECLFHGRGTPENHAEAEAWFRKAALQGHPGAQSNLGTMYGACKGNNVKEAVKWFRKAAERGDPEAQTKLGYMYFHGQGVKKQNLKEAEAWFRKAAEQGYGEAMYYIATLYDKGTGVEQSDVQAVSWYLKAANLGNHKAMWQIGGMYQNGRGVTPSLQEAQQWYNKGQKHQPPNFDILKWPIHC